MASEVTLDQYLELWEQDAAIRADALDEDARNVPLLHAKWWKFYARERLLYKKSELEYKTLYRQRWEYWAGKLDDAERTKLGWPVQPLKVLSQNMQTYLDGDSVLQEAVKKRTMAEEKCRFIEDVLKSINNRGFAIKNAIDFLKFKMGV